MLQRTHPAGLQICVGTNTLTPHGLLGSMAIPKLVFRYLLSKGTDFTYCKLIFEYMPKTHTDSLYVGVTSPKVCVNPGLVADMLGFMLIIF